MILTFPTIEKKISTTLTIWKLMDFAKYILKFGYF